MNLVFLSLVRCIITFFIIFSLTSYSFAESSNNTESVFDNIDDPDSDGEINSGLDDNNSVFNASIRNEEKSAKGNIGDAYYSSAKIIALNKITANSKEIIISIAEPYYFHNAEIVLKKCWKSPDRYMPNDQILLTVNEKKPDEDIKNIFNGWLISSQPALSSLEHPVYEIFAVECRGKVIQHGN